MNRLVVLLVAVLVSSGFAFSPIPTTFAAPSLQTLAVVGGQPDDIIVDNAGRLVWGDLAHGTVDRLQGNRVGDERIRAGLPKGWRVGDKTGTGERGTTNDVAFVWPPGRGPIIVTAYLTATTAATGERNAALAEVGRLAAAVVG